MATNGGLEAAALGLAARVEALLFVAPGPVSVSQLASALQESPAKIEAALEDLESASPRRGLRLQRHTSGLQLTTAAELGADVQRFLDLESTTRLTRAALEVLAIIAYQQPVTRPQIDSVRGVNSETVLRTLLRYGLIEELDRSESPGRPILYGTTPDFLQHFGLNALNDLPPMTPEPPAGKVDVEVPS